VTVGVATLFRWNYGPYGPNDVPVFGVAAAVACDRMITAGDIQYEPQQMKFAAMTPRVLISIAGDYSIHSEALLDTRKQIGIDTNTHPKNVALLYGKAIQAIKRRQAEDLHLAPLGMNTDTFLAQQRELLDSVANHLTDQLQKYQGEDVEALVVGSDGHDVLLYSVDTKGMIYYLNDVGFGAIGIGAWHAKSRLMQNGYVNAAFYPQALAAAYAAKKSAEVAPGVGKHTDMRLVLKDEISLVMPEILEKLESLYEDYERNHKEQTQRAITELAAFIGGKRKEMQSAEGSRTGNDGENAKTDECASAAASEAAQRNENENEQQPPET
jgi:hypothetical protein